MSVITRILLSLSLVGACVAAFPAAPAHADDGWAWPLDPRPAVVTPFDPPADDYGAGHRGVDLAGDDGDVVRAVAAGTVSYVGRIAGVGIITIDHGDTESTYQPVDPSVTRGEVISGGDPIGTLRAAGSHCEPDACLHLGRIVADEYADPLDLLSSSDVRLVTPFGAPPVAPPSPVGPVDGTGKLAMPVEGPVTSAYGMRLHPTLGVWKLHDGTDFGVACGTPVRAAEAGTVYATYPDAAYGNRVIIDHGSLAGAGDVVTTYNHLTDWTVSVGEHVARGDVVGHVGSTGYSTGCHLHFMVEVDGATVDPRTWL